MRWRDVGPEKTTAFINQVDEDDARDHAEQEREIAGDKNHQSRKRLSQDID
jgi:hypothetical protein